MFEQGRRYPSQVPRHAAGFSLVELMVALVVGLILIVGLTSLVVGNLQSYTELNKSGSQVENARYGAQFLRDELSMAGYYGNLTFKRAAPALPDDPCETSLAAVEARFDVFIEGADDSTATDRYACVRSMSIKSDTDVLLLRRVSTRAVALASRDADYLYLASNTKDFNILAGKASTSGITYITDARFNTVRQLFERILYVSSCDVCSGAGADTTPTLKMVEINNGAWSDPVSLVEGVEDLQMEYGIDSDENSTPEDWVAAPTAEQWPLVAAVRYHLLMRNVEDSPGHSDTRTYVMGLDADGSEYVVGPFNDGFKRHAYTMTVRLRNAAERREE